jgi:hypothetical protein
MPLFDYESSYLKDSALLKGQSANATTQITVLKDQLTAAERALSSNVYAGVVSQQDAVKNILVQETDRLNLKKQSIEQAKTGQDRVLTMNESYVMRNREYLKILIATCVILGAVAATFALQGQDLIPSGISTLLVVVLLTVWAIYSFNIYMGILGRDPIYFDQITGPAAPNSRATSTASATSANGGNLLAMADLGACVGSTCCAQGTQWEKATQTCRTTCSTATLLWNSTTGACVANTCGGTGANATKPNWNALTGTCVEACPTGQVWDSDYYTCTSVSNRPTQVASFSTMDMAYQNGEMPPPRKTLYAGTPPYDPQQQHFMKL